MKLAPPLRVLLVVAVVFLFLHPTPSHAAVSATTTSACGVCGICSGCGNCGCYQGGGSGICFSFRANMCLGGEACFEQCQFHGGGGILCDDCCNFDTDDICDADFLDRCGN
jgi:hypothetical protein